MMYQRPRWSSAGMTCMGNFVREMVETRYLEVKHEPFVFTLLNLSDENLDVSIVL
jgi:hypothetical protein